MKRYMWPPLVFVLLGAAISYGELSSHLREAIFGRFAARDLRSTVGMAQIKSRPTPPIVRGTGKLEPVREMEVVSRVPGRVTELRSKVGDRVTEGQLLAIVRPDELVERRKKVAAALAAARINLQVAETQLAEMEKKLERAREARQKDLIAYQDVKEAQVATDAARARQELAQAQVGEGQATLEQIEYLLGFSKLVAPLGGVVVRRLAEPGGYVEPSTPLFTVASLDPLKVVIRISASGLNSLHQGVAAQVRADALPDRVFEGRLAVRHAKLEATQTVSAEIELPNSDGLLAPGMNVEVTLIPGPPNIM